MLLDICTFISNLQHPSTVEVIDNLQSFDLCTNTQCFESLDEIAQMHIPAASETTQLFVTFMTMVFFILALMHPKKWVQSNKMVKDADTDASPPPPPSIA